MTCEKLLDLYLILLKNANNLEQCKDGHGACIHITAILKPWCANQLCNQSH